MSRRSSELRRLLHSNQLEFLIEAHNGLSARIAAETGFRGLWASSLTLSASLGLPDSDEASWSQVIDLVEFMADAADLPILLDGGTGYGGFNQLRRVVPRLIRRGVAGICIEDKRLKTNSLLPGVSQPLAAIDEFCGKLAAVRDSAGDDLVLVARVEAFIAGCGLDEALRRADAYQCAGADAILIHSAQPHPDEVIGFKRAWGERCPVVIVPTTYAHAPTALFREHGFAMLIWANQLLRAAVQAMQQAARTLYEQQQATALAGQIVPLAEIFRLQQVDELRVAELRYLPPERGIR